MNFVCAKLYSGEYHIIAVTETWLHSAFTDAMTQIPGYTLVRNDRQGRGSGGVALYIKSNIKYRILDRSYETGKKEIFDFCNLYYSTYKFLV